MGGSVTPFLESLESVIAAGLRRGSPPGRAQSGLPAMQRGRPCVPLTEGHIAVSLLQKPTWGYVMFPNPIRYAYFIPNPVRNPCSLVQLVCNLLT